MQHRNGFLLHNGLTRSDLALEGKVRTVPAKDPQRPLRDSALFQKTGGREFCKEGGHSKNIKSNQLKSATFNLVTSSSKQPRN